MSWPEHDPAPVPARPQACAWDQRPDEDTDAFLAFSAWLTYTGPGAYPHTSATRRWSAQHRWRSRRASYAQSLAATASRAAHEAVAEQGARHALALRELFDDALEDYLGATGKLAKKDAAKLLLEVAAMERLRAGEPGAIVREDFGGASTEDLDDLERALEQVERARKGRT